MEDYESKVMETVRFIMDKVNVKPDIAIILGSGLGNLIYEIQDPITIPYSELPNFPTSNVEGHAGNLILGKIYDKNVIVMQGRFHYYEGFTMGQIAFPIRVFAILGVEVMIVTNSAGGIKPEFQPGDLMLITDHINLSGNSPLIGKNLDLFGTRFPAMNLVYNKSLLGLCKTVASELGIPIHEGVYAYMTGPQYETAAEVRMLATIGASAVGMSSVPEVIAAAHSGIDVLGVSCITNGAASSLSVPNHKEVLEVANKIEDKFKAIIMDTIRRIKFNEENQG